MRAAWAAQGLALAVETSRSMAWTMQQAVRVSNQQVIAAAADLVNNKGSEVTEVSFVTGSLPFRDPAVVKMTAMTRMMAEAIASIVMCYVCAMGHCSFCSNTCCNFCMLC